MKENSKREKDHRKRVYEFYMENINLDKSYLVEKLPKSTIYNIIRRAENEKKDWK